MTAEERNLWSLVESGGIENIDLAIDLSTELFPDAHSLILDTVSMVATKWCGTMQSRVGFYKAIPKAFTRPQYRRMYLALSWYALKKTVNGCHLGSYTVIDKSSLKDYRANYLSTNKQLGFDVGEVYGVTYSGGKIFVHATSPF